MYYLKIFQVEERGWVWAWYTRADTRLANGQGTPSILQAYREAALWAAEIGPEDLCHSVIQFNGG